MEPVAICAPWLNATELTSLIVSAQHQRLAFPIAAPQPHRAVPGAGGDLRPSGLNATELTPSLCPRSTSGSPFPSLRHSRTEPSPGAGGDPRPASGLNATELTWSPCPRSTSGSPFPSLRHSRTGAVPGAGGDPYPVWTERHRSDPGTVSAQHERLAFPSLFHTRAVLSSEPVTIRFPSGLSAPRSNRQIVSAQHERLAFSLATPHPRGCVVRARDHDRLVPAVRSYKTIPSWPRRTIASPLPSLLQHHPVHVWMAPVLQGRLWRAGGCRLRSCVRPLARSLTAGPDGFRGARPRQFCGLEGPVHEPGCPRCVGRPIHHHALLPSQADAEPGTARPSRVGTRSRGAAPPRRCARACWPERRPRPDAAGGRAAPSARDWRRPPWASAAPPGRR